METSSKKILIGVLVLAGILLVGYLVQSLNEVGSLIYGAQIPGWGKSIVGILLVFLIVKIVKSQLLKHWFH